MGEDSIRSTSPCLTESYYGPPFSSKRFYYDIGIFDLPSEPGTQWPSYLDCDQAYHRAIAQDQIDRFLWNDIGCQFDSPPDPGFQTFDIGSQYDSPPDLGFQTSDILNPEIDDRGKQKPSEAILRWLRQLLKDEPWCIFRILILNLDRILELYGTGTVLDAKSSLPLLSAEAKPYTSLLSTSILTSYFGVLVDVVGAGRALSCSTLRTEVSGYLTLVRYSLTISSGTECYPGSQQTHVGYQKSG
jgi:hypothetical protein